MNKLKQDVLKTWSSAVVNNGGEDKLKRIKDKLGCELTTITQLFEVKELMWDLELIFLSEALAKTSDITSEELELLTTIEDFERFKVDRYVAKHPKTSKKVIDMLTKRYNDLKNGIGHDLVAISLFNNKKTDISYIKKWAGEEYKNYNFQEDADCALYRIKFRKEILENEQKKLKMFRKEMMARNLYKNTK